MHIKAKINYSECLHPSNAGANPSSSQVSAGVRARLTQPLTLQITQCARSQLAVRFKAKAFMLRGDANHGTTGPPHS